MSEALHRRRPELSVVVVVYNMAREAPRTLRSLSATYQRDIAADDYEIIVIDNGSTPAFDTGVIDELEGNFRVIRLYPASSSPAEAINIGLAAARGDVIGVMIDGARLVTPGLLHFARVGAKLYPSAVVATLGWYLGLDQQRWAIECGYNKDREDQLLRDINWPENGYQLFDISAPDETTVDGWYGSICETNALFLTRKNWDILGGVDERFDVAGGGFLNLDLMHRAIDLPGSKVVLLAGEGTFHQLHGGTATNAHPNAISGSVEIWRNQYEAIRGKAWEPPRDKSARVMLGVLPRAALRHFTRAVLHSVSGQPLGETFDKTLWSYPVPLPEDPVAAALVELARTELREQRFRAAAAVARIARAHFPDDPAAQDILGVTAGWLRGAADPNEYGPIEQTRFYFARAKAFEILGQTDLAAQAYADTIRVDDDHALAYLGLARMRMPGPLYGAWLQNLHRLLKPETYLEIGVLEGQSLSYANAPTRAIGVDPVPNIKYPFVTETHIYSETSDEFFAKKRLPQFLEGKPLSMAFIDGLHHFRQSLRDFINTEAHCAWNSVIVLHDTLPFDELTQRAERQRRFYTGDIWKTVLCLKHFRPELDITTVRSGPSGLTIITNLDPNSQVLTEHFEQAIELFVNADYHEIFNGDFETKLNVRLNDWDAFSAHLSGRLFSDASAPSAALEEALT